MQTANQPTELGNLTDEEIQKRLAGGPLEAPLTFRGRTLAKYTSGLRDLVMKVVRPQDTAIMHDAVLLHVLAEAHGATDADRLAQRRALLSATDDIDAFRAQISLILDDLADDDISAAKQLVDRILKPVQLAQVAVVAAAGKKKSAGKAKRSRTMKHS
jgi:hypothetical protein